MRHNHALKRLRAGETVRGLAMQCYRSAEIPRAFAAAGFDWVFFDLEHSGFDLETTQDMIASSVAAGITPLVRPAELTYSLIARVLDVGAQGVILPRVEDPVRLAEAVSWTRYPPTGTRGFGMLAPFVDYEQRTMAEVMAHTNANTMVVVQFETQTSLDRAHELLSVPGIDVAMVGPADLSISLGVPGDFENPRLVDAVLRLMETCSSHGVVPGIHCRSAALAAPWIRRGMRFAGAGSEQALLYEKLRETMRTLQEVETPAAPAVRG